MIKLIGIHPHEIVSSHFFLKMKNQCFLSKTFSFDRKAINTSNVAEVGCKSISFFPHRKAICPRILVHEEAESCLCDMCSDYVRLSPLRRCCVLPFSNDTRLPESRPLSVSWRGKDEKKKNVYHFSSAVLQNQIIIVGVPMIYECFGGLFKLVPNNNRQSSKKLHLHYLLLLK